jgi:hypothetical protein
VKVALFSGKDCEQLALLRAVLEERGVTPLLFDMRLGADASPTLSFGAHAHWAGYDFADVGAAYIRCTTPNTLPAPPAMLNAASYCEYRAAFLREQSFSAATRGFFAALSAAGTLVVNELDRFADHDTKPQFYEKLRTLGFPVPDTLTTSDARRAAEFTARHREVVAKPAAGVGSTRVVGAQDAQRMQLFGVCPVLMQERIRGQTVRVNVVGDTMVLALRILGSELTVDSRTAPRGFEPVDMPPGECARIVRANRALGLHYSAWDVIEAAPGRYVYLDCNPGPYILWTGERFSRAVLQELATYLATFARTRSLAEASAAVRRCAIN